MLPLEHPDRIQIAFDEKKPESSSRSPTVCIPTGPTPLLCTRARKWADSCDISARNVLMSAGATPTRSNPSSWRSAAITRHCNCGRTSSRVWGKRNGITERWN